MLNAKVLCQGTTLVGPKGLEITWALAPVSAVSQGLKPSSVTLTSGTTEVVP
jgi:hypothetical protein